MNCLDSSFVIDFLDSEAKHHDAAKRWMEEHADEPLAVPPICAFEVLRGAARTDTNGYKNAKSFLRDVTVPQFGFEEAVTASEFDAEMHGDGTPLSARDTLVASYAHTTGYALVTRDRDFDDAPVETEFYV